MAKVKCQRNVEIQSLEECNLLKLVDPIVSFDFWRSLTFVFRYFVRVKCLSNRELRDYRRRVQDFAVGTENLLEAA